ncbi:WecB/TagA/CpsF family glycosyltransferase [Paenibacillus mendelii]|uniref:N-acetylglucosaminyldiphosphoundecaprenol N-acetyl-beta-D-mannosaminyltransferase n=1 Tax=Paenibacillus mendelii TaxID=206163 RepID=A0ABV6J973_9BACL|nr:WecB/TagA/CpsF family glycosyltransferase [Paenibacillus mendelii]MCQ6561205.1 WecB/TagA/CpsF family glycosyltransferase [Paenibacillus mendelii]
MENAARIMGIPFPKMTMDQSVQVLSKVVEKEQTGLFHVVTGNPEIVMSCQHDKQLRSIVDEAGLVTADGIGIVMVSRLRGGNLPERVTGCDLLYKLLEAGNQEKWSFYFLGADEPTSQQAAERIRRDYPNVSILGRHHGFFNEEEEVKIIEEIRAATPDFLIVALGAPYAERWIHKHKEILHAKIAMGVGGSLDIIAGKVRRAPRVWQKFHMEWLFRLINQPSRWKRQLILPRFAVRALLYRERKA